MTSRNQPSVSEIDNRNIILTGFMGTGKSTVGKLLSERLKRPFIDMDAMIEEREGRKISDIFASDGEPAFRAMERKLVQELSILQGQVIATGGGVVLDQDNIRDFERTGLLVCIDASPERILARVEHETHRPLLAGPGKQQRIRELLEKRRAAYETVSFHIDTDQLTADQVAEAIIGHQRRSSSSSRSLS